MVKFKALIFICSFERNEKKTRPRGYKNFSCSIQLCIKVVQLIHLKLLTIANSLLLNIAEHENFSVNNYENAKLLRKKKKKKKKKKIVQCTNSTIKTA